jgi:peptidoglycan/xylan/chitin deacetylase (PgdA/CDA1 family)
MRKKALAGHALTCMGMNHLLPRLRALFLSDVLVLGYHRVLDIDDETEYPFDRDLISTSVAGFEWQMEYVKRHFTPIPFSELIHFIDGKGRLPKRPIVITFDDGFDDNYYNAFPVLRTLGIPAILFVTTGYIGADHTFWYDWVTCVVRSIRADRLALSGLGMTFKLDSTNQSRDAACMVLLEQLKKIPNAQRLAILEELDQRYGMVYREKPEHVKKLSRPLTWNQIREMADHGIEFGSHTVTHPILTKVEEGELSFELEQSRKILQERTGQEIRALCYPNGQQGDFDARVQQAAMRAGYSVGVAFIHGTNFLHKIERYAIKRIHISGADGRNAFPITLTLPELAS